MSSLISKYGEIKKVYPDTLLLFRNGDNYDAYFDDAIDCANILSLTLNHVHERKQNYEQAVFPFHQLDVQLPKLVRAGKRVAICDNINN